ncbi:MAG: bis(5'-nucleosyl)-tetraphosphatase (symmetrical) YqeK [Dehalococcoidia bacterium]
MQERLERRLQALPRGLREHTMRVRQIALELARHHGVDQERVALAALGHDIARAMRGEELLERAEAVGLTIHPVERSLPVLLHGPVGRHLLQHDEGLAEPEVLEAVHWHTTAQRDLGPVAKVIFLADKLDPHKAGRYPYLRVVRELAFRDLDAAMLEFLNHELARFLERGHSIHPASVEARNQLLLRGQ